MGGTLFPEFIKLLLTVALGLLQRLNLRSELLKDLGVHILFLSCSRQLLLHYDLVVPK